MPIIIKYLIKLGTLRFAQPKQLERIPVDYRIRLTLSRLCRCRSSGLNQSSYPGEGHMLLRKSPKQVATKISQSIQLMDTSSDN
jgi:hypothetical protein